MFPGDALQNSGGARGGLWSAPGAAGGGLVLALLGVLAVSIFVDLSPRVEGDFFFAEDDPQMRASVEVEERFPSNPQVILRVGDLGGDVPAYRDRIDALTEDLLSVEGVQSGYSITTEDPARSPLFGRILLTRDSTASNIVLQTDDTDPEVLLPRLEAAVEAHVGPELGVVMSGVPVIVEQIRRALFRDLVVFSTAALFVFALLIGLVYRDAAIVVGTLATCVVSVSATLLIVRALGVGIGLLTANLVTIVFVLTLSHVVFLTANWSRAVVRGAERPDAVVLGVRDTVEGSFWSMTTTLLGFLSLLVASARPLRELGLAGAVGAVVAMSAAYAVYPAFLGRWAKARRPEGGPTKRTVPGTPVVVTAATTVIVLVLGLGVLRLDTDPGLLTYFAAGTELREGLEQVDRDAGSSILDIVVRDPTGARVDSDEVFRKMSELQLALEADTAVGQVLSPPVLIGHARTMPLASFFPVRILLDLAASPQLGEIGLIYVNRERDQGRFFLRMRESVDEPSRDAVIERLRDQVLAAGLEPALVGGLYDLQSQLGKLIASSLRIGIGGLLLLFLAVAFLVSRSFGTTVRMWLCLASVPLVVLGAFGYLGIAVDIITSPAANIALAIGVDSMIHLVVRVRRLSGADSSSAWSEALSQIRGPVIGATAIICAGFGIFTLSTFPPTQRFGIAVILGTVTAATMALVVLPRLAALGATEAEA